MKSPFSLDDLMMLHEVLSAGSLTKASANLQLAKSTVSRRVSSLEAQIGSLLLKRNTRRLVPTEIGLELFERCERIAHEVAELGALAESSRSEVRGTLRVSIPSEFGSAWLGRAISEFALEYPDLQLEIDIATEPVNLIDEPYDVAINFGRLRDSRLAYRRLATLARGIYASPAYLRAHPLPRTLEELVDHAFIVTDVQQREGTLVLGDKDRRRRIAITRRVMVNSMRLAREMVLGGTGLAVLPHVMCRGHVTSKALVPILPGWKCPPVQATAVVLARRGLPRKTRAFLDFVSQRLETMEGDPAARA